MIDALILADNQALDAIRSFFYRDSEFFRVSVLILADLQWIVMALFLVGLWLYGTKKQDPTYKVRSLNIFYMIIGGFALYVMLNQFLPIRVRPETITSVPPLVSHLPDNSFPSGHAIFAAASWLAMHYFMHNRILTLTVLLLGIIMCIARIVAGVHYPGDIFAGFIVGVIGAFATYQLLDLAIFRKWINPFLLHVASYLKL